jgi:serine/threonine-protein kinase HipA
LIEQISDAVSDTAPKVREAMDEHPGFRQLGKRLLQAWSEGVQSLRDKQAFAMPGWTPGSAFEGFSDPPRLKATKRVTGRRSA